MSPRKEKIHKTDSFSLCTLHDSFDVEITNDVPINVQCKSASLYLDNNGAVSIVAAEIASFTYYCVQFSISLSKSTFTCADLGTQTVGITTSDVVNSPATTNCQVQIADNIEPIVSCHAYTVVLNSAGTGSITTANVVEGLTDNCPGSTASVSPSNFNCAMLGENSVLVTASDSSKNQGFCTSVVTVFDETPPTLTCKSFTTTISSTGFAVISAANVVSNASDNCGTPKITLSKSNFDCSDVGTNQVTVTATDAAGNQASCVASVTISDTLGATPTCQNVSLFLNQLGSATLYPSQAVSQISGGCGTVSISASTTSFSCSSGTTTSSVQITATDSYGIQNSCTSQVTVSDPIYPVLTCQPLSLSLTSSASIPFVPLNAINQIVDNCPSSFVTLSASQTSLGCSNVGTNPIQITGTDAYGNMESCVSTVTLTMTVPPTLTCPSGIQTANLSNAYPGTYSFSAASSASATAVCGSSTITGDMTYGCSNIGLNSATVTATDSYGNKATCAIQLNVVDSTKPVVTCPSTSYIYINNGTAIFNASAVASVSDNCGAKISSNATNGVTSVTTTAFNCTSIGSQTIGITATDTSGNMGVCNTQLIISRPTPAVATCKPTVVLNLESPSYTGSLNSSMLLQSYSDACPVVSSSISPKTNYSISDLSSGPLNVVVTLVDSQPSNFNCTSSVYIIVPILDGVSNFRKIHTGFVIRWINSIPNFKGQTVTLYYYNFAGNKVLVNPIPVQYNTGSYNWIGGFNQVTVNNYYNLYMMVGSLLVDIFPIFVVA